MSAFILTPGTRSLLFDCFRDVELSKEGQPKQFNLAFLKFAH